MRKAAVSGKFYPSNRDELKKTIDKFFILNTFTGKYGHVFGAIVPHAGYVFSGRCISYAYGAIKNFMIDTFVILGTNHSGLGSKISLSIEDLSTVMPGNIL